MEPQAAGGDASPQVSGYILIFKGKVFVGGAVLTKEYADMIGADYYSKDAKEAVEIAKEFFKS